MNCAYCGEPVDEPRPETIGLSRGCVPVHRECRVRMVLGSAAHQLGECSCFGGTRHDPPTLTLRESAMLAYETHLALRVQ